MGSKKRRCCKEECRRLLRGGSNENKVHSTLNKACCFFFSFERPILFIHTSCTMKGKQGMVVQFRSQ